MPQSDLGKMVVESFSNLCLQQDGHLNITYLTGAVPHICPKFPADKSSALQVIQSFETRSTASLAQVWWHFLQTWHRLLLLGGWSVENKEGTYQAVWTNVWFFSQSRTWRYMTMIWNHKTIFQSTAREPGVALFKQSKKQKCFWMWPNLTLWGCLTCTQKPSSFRTRRSALMTWFLVFM